MLKEKNGKSKKKIKQEYVINSFASGNVQGLHAKTTGSHVTLHKHNYGLKSGRAVQRL